MRYIITYTVPGFGINTSCIKAIKSMYNARRGPNASRIREMNEYLEAEKEVGKYKVAQESEHDTETTKEILLENLTKL